MATTESLARFAIEQHNKKENRKLKFVEAGEVTKQVVAGTEYSFTVTTTDGKFEAKVSETMGLKELLEFKPAPTKA